MNDRAAHYTNQHCMLKLAEELNELAAEVLKFVNKGCCDPANMCDKRAKRIVDEIADVEKWIERVKPVVSISNDDG